MVGRAPRALAKPLSIGPGPAIGWQHPEGKRHIPTWQAECYSFGVVPYEGFFAVLCRPVGIRSPLGPFTALCGEAVLAPAFRPGSEPRMSIDREARLRAFSLSGFSHLHHGRAHVTQRLQ